MNFTSSKFSVQFHRSTAAFSPRDICCDDGALPIFYGEKKFVHFVEVAKNHASMPPPPPPRPPHAPAPPAGLACAGYFFFIKIWKTRLQSKVEQPTKEIENGLFFLHCFCIWFLKKAGKGGGGPFSSAVKRYIDSNLLIAPPPLWKRSTFRAKPIRPFSFSRKTSSRRISAAAAAVTKAAPLNS